LNFCKRKGLLWFKECSTFLSAQQGDDEIKPQLNTSNLFGSLTKPKEICENDSFTAPSRFYRYTGWKNKKNSSSVSTRVRSIKETSGFGAM